MGCLPKFGELEFATEEPRRYFIPVLSTAVTIADALGENDFAGTLIVDDEGDYVLTRGETVIDAALLEALSVRPVSVPIDDTSTVRDLGAFGIPLPVSRLDFASASLRVTLANPFSEPVSVVLTTGNFRRGSDSLTLATTIPADGGLDTVLDYSGGSFVIGEDELLTSRYDARLPDGRRVALGAGVFAVEQFTPSSVEGMASDLTVPLGRFAVPTDFLADFEPGRARVAEAGIELEIVSGLTAEARATGTATFAVLRDGSRLDIATPFSSGVTLAPATPGGRTRTELLLDGENSDLLTALLAFPDSVVFEVEATLNPGPPARAYRIAAGDSVRLAYAATVPLSVAFDDFAQVDTLALPALGALERVSAAALQIVTANAIPVGASLEVDLLDEFEVGLVDLLGDGATLDPAAYDAESGAVKATSRDTIRVPIAADALPLLRSPTRAVLRVGLQTDSQAAGFVQLRPDQTLDFSVGLDVTLAREP